MRSNRPLNSLAQAAVAIFVTIALAGPARQAAAQGVWASISNQFLRAELGESGTENNNKVEGRFRVTDLSTGNIIMFGPTIDQVGTGGGINVPGSFLTVRIDGGAPAGGWDLVFGDQTTGTWISSPPIALNGRIFARWATLPGTVATNPVPPIEVSAEITLVHDVVCYKFTVYNGIVDTLPPTPASGSHSIGLRFAQNYTTDGAGNEGPVFAPNTSQICTETVLVAGQVPAFWQHFDSSGANPIGGVLKPTTSDISFIPPDQFLISDGTLTSELWEHTPNNIPNFNICTDPWDAMAGVYWNPRSFAPGQSRNYVTYFGRQDTSIDFGQPWPAGVSGPVHLTFTPGSQNPLQPNPFAVTAFATNTTAFALTNVTATISLPTGLALASGETPTKSAGNVGAGGEASFTWQVVPTGAASGTLTYSVSFSAGPGVQGKVVTRTIDIPGLPSQQFQTGLQMVSFPYTFDNPAPATALGIPATNFALLRWDPALLQYTAVSQIVPGQGYWLNLSTGTTINLQGAHPVTATGQYEIVLQNGWNQIGNPFLLPVNFADVQVITSDQSDPNHGLALTPDQAQAAGLIQSTLFRYDPASNSYTFDPTTNTDLVPFVGYWIHALKPNVSLLIPAPSPNRSVRVRRAATIPSLAGHGWQQRIVASANGVRDAYNFIGVAAPGGPNSSLNLIEKPPFSAKGTGLTIQRTDAKGRAAAYARDIEAADGSRKTWSVSVRSGTPNQEVTVSWPDIASLPRGYELYVLDPASGNRTSMRQTASLTVNTGSAGMRSLTITAEPRAAGGGFVLIPTVRQTGRGTAASIDVTTTADATIAVTVRSAHGVVRNLVTGRAATVGGTTSLTWDMRDNKGVPVPSGAYLVEVKGTTSSGQSNRALVPFTVTR